MADNNKKKYIKYEDTTYILEDSRIPDPVAADNGKVLGVVNGVYALKQEEGGGGGTGTVKSVNNVQPDANGNVTLSIPSKTSDLQNDSGFLTEHQSLAAYRTASAQDTIDAAQDEAIGAKYSKPSGGIPASDLASAVQTSLGKADTALQQHQSLSGYATEQWVENKGYLTQHQSLANYQTKAITDTGGYYTTDTVEGALQEIGAELASAGSASVPRIAKASTDTTATIEPNKLYVFPEMASLTITLAAITDNTIVNEYHFVFDSGSAATVLTLPATVLQPDGFTVEANMHYEISILEGAMTAQGWAVSSS